MHLKKSLEEKKSGDGGYRSPYLSHAKRALYHLSYVPFSASEQQISLGHPSCVKVKLQVTLPANQSYPCVVLSVTHITFDSSVGRAVDCSWHTRETDIHRSLVRIRLEGVLLLFIQLYLFSLQDGRRQMRGAREISALWTEEQDIPTPHPGRRGSRCRYVCQLNSLV